MRHLLLLLALAGLVSACGVSWDTSPERPMPSEDDRLVQSIVHLVSPKGIEGVTSALWSELEPRYADGFFVEIEARVMGQPGTTLVIYGPGSAEIVPSGISLTPRESGSVGVSLEIAELAAELDVRVPGRTGGELSCHGSVRFEQSRYDFVVAVEDATDPFDDVSVVSVVAGDLFYEQAFAELAECDFGFQTEHEQQLLAVVRDELETALAREWNSVLKTSVSEALSPRFSFGGRLAAAFEPRAIGDGSVATSHLALEVHASAALTSAGPGIGQHFNATISAGISPWDRTSFGAPPEALPLTLPATEVTSDGQPWDEALVVSRALIERGLRAVEHVGLVSTRLPVGGIGYEALWPSHMSHFLERMTGDDYTLRLGLRESLELQPELSVSRPAAEGSDGSTVQVSASPLVIEVYGRLGDVEPLLTTLRVRGLELQLRPDTDDEGWLYLEVTGVHIAEIEVEDGAVTLPDPSVALVELLLWHAVPITRFAPLGDIGARPPRILATDWIDDESYVLYLSTELGH